jgi:hypothetical protein
MFDTDIFLSTNKSGPECPKRIAMMTADIERTIRYGEEKLAIDTYNTITGKSLTKK